MERNQDNKESVKKRNLDPFTAASKIFNNESQRKTIKIPSKGFD